MRKFVILTLIMALSVFAWLVAERLSPDAVGMAVGMLFGVLAGVPTALLMMAGNRRRRDEDDDEEQQYANGYGRYAMNPYAHQAPVIVLTAPQMQQPPMIDATAYPSRSISQAPPPNQPGARQFRLVGEREEMIEEW